jgi:hypothetical protein
LGTAQVATRVGDSSKILDRDSGKESGTVSDKDPGKRPGKKFG